MREKEDVREESERKRRCERRRHERERDTERDRDRETERQTDVHTHTHTHTHTHRKKCVRAITERGGGSLCVFLYYRGCVYVDCLRKGAAHSFSICIDVAALSCPAELPWSCVCECLIEGTRKRRTSERVKENVREQIQRERKGM